MNGRRTRSAETDRLLQAVLRQQPPESSGGSGCPAPELLAAYVERSLDINEAAGIEAHAATCDRCQEVLAAFVQTLPPSTTEATSWLADMATWKLRWLVPAGAVAAVAFAVYLVTGRPDRVVEEPVQMASRIDGTQAPATNLPPSAPGSTEPAAPSKPTPEVDRETVLSKAGADEVRSAERKADASTPTPPEREEVAAQAAPAPAQEAMAEAPSKRLMGRAKVGSTWNEAGIPEGRVRIRVGTGGAIERSDDGGTTWTAQMSGVSVDLTAVSPVSSRICWAAGRQGTVLLTTDGGTWERRPFPVNTDLVAISATDRQAATVTTVDGRRFATRDGGASWQALP